MTSPTRTKPPNQAKNHQSHPNEGRLKEPKGMWLKLQKQVAVALTGA
jgi:hypothetical protein